jgi:hypothetical protein
MKFLHSELQLVVTANAVPSSLILVSLMMVAILSSEKRLLQEPHDVTPQRTAFLIMKLRSK